MLIKNEKEAPGAGSGDWEIEGLGARDRGLGAGRDLKFILP